jgi:hypothetical protein
MPRSPTGDPSFGKADRLSIFLVASSQDVTPLAGGAARCKEIDKFVYDNYVANHNQKSSGGLLAESRRETWRVNPLRGCLYVKINPLLTRAA